MENIKIRGVREHNLKNINIDKCMFVCYILRYRGGVYAQTECSWNRVSRA